MQPWEPLNEIDWKGVGIFFGIVILIVILIGWKITIIAMILFSAFSAIVND